MDNRIALTGGGQLTLREEGTLVRLEVLRPDDGRGLYKVWLLGAQGRFLLGTLVPENGSLCLRRRVSRGSLAQAGCWPVIGGECVMAFAFGQPAEKGGWRPEEHPEGLVRDEVLRQSLEGKRMQLERREDGFRLAGRFSSQCPFPLVPLFCLARIEEVGGQLWAVFDFDGEGNVKREQALFRP